MLSVFSHPKVPPTGALIGLLQRNIMRILVLAQLPRLAGLWRIRYQGSMGTIDEWREQIEAVTPPLGDKLARLALEFLDSEHALRAVELGWSELSRPSLAGQRKASLDSLMAHHFARKPGRPLFAMMPSPWAFLGASVICRIVTLAIKQW